MRYYNIVISDPTTGSTTGLPQFSSLFRGQTDPGALTIELDIPVTVNAEPSGAALLRIWGIPLKTISQASNLTGKNIQVYGGMAKGLPLANPAQAGLLVAGTIFPAFGNWQGTEMTLDITIVPYLNAGVGNDANIVVNWKAGQSLATALANTLKTAFPAWKQDINISPNLILSHDVVGYYGNLTQLAQYIGEVSTSIIGGSYPGVDLVQYGSKIRAFDGTQQQTPVQINFQDLIGQPTWLDLYQLQFKAVMRADIGVGDLIKLPPTLVTTTANASIPSPAARNNTSFQGIFLVQSIRHVGAFRQPAGESWNTTFDCTPQMPQADPPDSGFPIQAPASPPPPTIST